MSEKEYKTTEAQRRAQKKWRERNRKREALQSAKRAGIFFIKNHAIPADLEQFKQAVEAREKDIESARVAIKDFQTMTPVIFELFCEVLAFEDGTKTLNQMAAEGRINLEMVVNFGKECLKDVSDMWGNLDKMDYEELESIKEFKRWINKYEKDMGGM
ncbi:hypothetical protein [Listeria booriae]|uniref:Uncharacterized protein n=1 Tax=Listeria booriae TaxID=1552123 RepID=A0A842FEM3_9LIST|nr:hypothetical protein [Listeria booriae]MBC2242261.1 hypothetical protein [Listeria booriae]